MYFCFVLMVHLHTTHTHAVKYAHTKMNHRPDAIVQRYSLRQKSIQSHFSSEFFFMVYSLDDKDQLSPPFKASSYEVNQEQNPDWHSNRTWIDSIRRAQQRKKMSGPPCQHLTIYWKQQPLSVCLRRMITLQESWRAAQNVIKCDVMNKKQGVEKPALLKNIW